MQAAVKQDSIGYWSTTGGVAAEVALGVVWG